MKLDRCTKLYAFVVLMLSSVCISTAILSTETLNVEPTASSAQENAVDKPHIATNGDIFSEKFNKKSIETKKTNVKSEETSIVDGSEKEIDIEKNAKINVLKSIIEENIQLEREASGDDKIAQDFPTPTPISIEDTSKDIIIETPIVGNIDNVIGDTKNDSILLQKQPIIPPIATSIEDEPLSQNESSNEAEQAETNKTEPLDGDTMDKGKLNLTEENQIPVFSEWAQKRLEEVEKEVEQEAVNTSTMKKNTPTANKPPILKLKNSKNYASPDCGAKIIAANSESSGVGYVLTSTRDEYLLSPCKSRIWFVVELCEAIQAERIDLANYELFSSSPKNFSVGVSSRFPTRDWTNVGKFIAKDERYIQNFDLYPHLFGKYVRVDIHSHYNSEHFCPISLFRVYGTSEFEAFETENRQHPIDDIDDDDEDDQESDTNKGKSNIFKSASDAVMSIVDTVKKAASFVKPHGKINPQNVSSTNLLDDNCISPNHPISCENCSDEMTQQVTALVKCKQNFLKRLLSIEIIKNSLYKSQICNTLIGIELNVNCSEPTGGSTTSEQLTDLQMDYIHHLFSIKYITAMCNLLAAVDRKITFNSTIAVNIEPPINVTIDKKAGDQLLATQIDPKPSADIQNDKPETVTGDKHTEQPINIPEEKLEKNMPIDPNESRTESTEFEQIETTTALPTIENNQQIVDKGSQNIFNVVEEASTESQGIVADVIVAETSIIPSLEQTPSPVIILPETTTQIPNNDLGDSSEEQSNGWTNTPQFGQKLHSESVFLRLSNRVKALERNMSLSGQYLEELSRRYKKQVEDLQTSFAKTLLNIEEQSRKNLERKQELFEQNQKLRNDLEILTDRIFSWKNILICCLCFTCVQVLIFHLILKLWGRKYGQETNHLSTEPSSSEVINDDTLTRKRKSGNVPVKFRRKSAEEKRERNISESSTSALQRRPSTEALNITGTYADLLIDESNSNQNAAIDYHHNQRITQHNKSTSSESHEADISGYVRIEDLKELYNKPEDEYEFYGPITELKRTDSGSLIDDGGSQTTIESNDCTASSPPKKGRKNKNRRLSSPSFFKSPFSSGSAQSTGWEWHRSKKSKNSSHIKSKSESPPSLKQNGINNNNTTPTSIDNQKITRTDPSRSSIDDRKTSGSFKRILKKIF